MSNIFKKLTYILFSTTLLTANYANAQETDNYSCLEDSYSYNQCKFDLPEIKNGETKVISSETGLFEGRLLVLCNNGKRSIISESCEYAQGEEDSCKGIPSNSWTGSNNAMCSHTYVATSVPNGDDFKVSSTNGNGFVTYQCEDAKLKVTRMDCTNPDAERLVTAQATGVQCSPETYNAEVVFDYFNNEYVAVPPNDTFCVNEGYDYLQTFSLNTTNAQIQATQSATYNAVCCSTDTLNSPPQETIITPINSDCSNVQMIMAGDFNSITGEASNPPSDNKILNNACKPNGFDDLMNYSVNEYTNGNITYIDEFEVEAVCCGNTNIGENNTECKGQFISSGVNAEKEARALGIPFICDSSTGTTECYQNSCTAFVAPSELCADCDLGNYTFNLNSNTCTTNIPVIPSGHNTTEEFYNNTHSGYVEISCMNGGELVEDGRCFRNCLDRTVSWQNEAGTATCYQNLTDNKYRHYLTPTDNDRSNPHMEIGDKTGRLQSIAHTGVAEFHCDDGQWVENSEDLIEQICFADCSATLGSWGTGTSKDGRDKTNACSANLGNQRHYVRPNFSASNPMANPSYDSPTPVTSIDNTGAASFRCNDGNWEVSGAQTCNLDCQAQTVSWTVNGKTTSARVGASTHGDVLRDIVGEVVNTGQGNTNRSLSSVTDLRCDDGLYVPIGSPTVWEDCAAGSTTTDSANYNNVCDFAWGAMRHGDSQNIGATGNGTGQALARCVDGNVELDIVTECNKTCDTSTVTWPRSSGDSSNCPTGFSQNGNLCERTNTVLPSCSSGFNYNTSTNQCERVTGTTDTYRAVAACQGNYSDYEEDGFDCEKEYITDPSCPSGFVFRGNTCQAINPTNTGTTWTCPSTSVDPSTPNGARAGSWSYRATYGETTTTEIDPTCSSGTFNRTTGMCETPCAEQCGQGNYFKFSGNVFGNNQKQETRWTLNNGSRLYIKRINLDPNSNDPELDLLLSGARFVTSGIQYNNFVYYPKNMTITNGNYNGDWGSIQQGELCRQNDSTLSGSCGSSVRGTCPSGYDLQPNGRCRQVANRTNVCIRDIVVTPTCDSGYTWNGSQCQGTVASSSPTLSCESSPLSGSGIYHGIFTRNFVNSLPLVSDTCRFDQCCLYSEYNCSTSNNPIRGGGNPRTTICDWQATEAQATCPSGTTLSGDSCVTQSFKDGNCPTGFSLDGNVCKEVDVIDANQTCADGSTAPCTSNPTANATCDPIRLDTGATAIPSVQGSFCRFNHVVTNAATRTCPSGGSPTGNICYVSGTNTETEIPVCSNGGTLNTSTDRCVAIESVPAIINESVTCSASASSRLHNGTRSLTDNTTNGATGSANVVCDDGNWIVQSGAVCNKDCSSTISASSVSTGTLEWGTGDSLAADHPAFGLNCYHNPLSVSSYGHDADRNNVSTLESNKLVGQISYTCNDGFWEVTSDSCSRMACNSASGGSTVSWSDASTCNVSSPTGLKWGDQTTMNQPFGYSGDIDATVRCVNNGGFQVMNSNAECYKDCDGTEGSGFGINWSESVSGCSATYNNYITHDTDGIAIRDTTGSARGRTYIKCENGSVLIDGAEDEDCKKLVNSGRTVRWNNTNGSNGSTGNCVGTLPEDLISIGPTYGAEYCTTVTNTDGDYTGEATVCATSTGDVTVTNATCGSNSCPSRSFSWLSNYTRNCTGTIPETAAGEIGVAVDNTGSTRGTNEYRCNSDGTWNTTAIPFKDTCESSCTSTVTWDGGNCSDTVTGSLLSGASKSITNENSGYTGSGTATCKDGSWDVDENTTCEADAPPVSCSWSSSPMGCTNIGGQSTQSPTSRGLSCTTSNENEQHLQSGASCGNGNSQFTRWTCVCN